MCATVFTLNVCFKNKFCKTTASVKSKCNGKGCLNNQTRNPHLSSGAELDQKSSSQSHLMTVNIIKSTTNGQAQSVLEANMLTAIHFFS